MTILLKSLLLLGTFALLAPGVAARVLGLRPGEGLGGWAHACLWLGGALVASVSLATAAAAVSAFSGGLELGLIAEYLRSSRHGRLTLLRLGLLALLVALGLGEGLGKRPPRRLERLLYPLAALGFLLTLSLTAHAGALGVWPVLADLLHLSAAVLWIGAVMGLALLPDARAELAGRLAPRVSQAGLVSVLLVSASGVYSATLHLFGLAALTTSLYGRLLFAKLLLVALILGIAALNRWWLLSALEKRGDSFLLRRLVRLELLLLALVLIATGALSSTQPAHPPGFHKEHAPSGLGLP